MEKKNSKIVYKEQRGKGALKEEGQEWDTNAGILMRSRGEECDIKTLNSFPPKERENLSGKNDVSLGQKGKRVNAKGHPIEGNKITDTLPTFRKTKLLHFPSKWVGETVGCKLKGASRLKGDQKGKHEKTTKKCSYHSLIDGVKRSTGKEW